MIVTREMLAELKSLAKAYPVVTVTGPRQSGKTTLVKMAFPKRDYYNLEDPDVRDLARSDPRAFLKKSKKGIVLDEVHNAPELLSYIQGIVDSTNASGQFIITGSQQFGLLSKITQSLAGRTALLKLLPFSIHELNTIKSAFSIDEYLFYGFYPRIHDKKLNPTKAYRNYFDTYIERDLRNIVNVKDLRLFRKFVKLCAGRIGQIFIASNLSNEVGVSVTTIHSWLSILEASYITIFLEPYFANIKKRLIKSPKLYFCDPGLAVYLLGIESIAQIERDPLRGSLVENAVILEMIKKRYNKGLDHNLFFYRDSHGNEVDVLMKKGNKLIPFEIKAAETFNTQFLKNLKYIKKIFADKISNGYLVYAGDHEQDVKGNRVINYKHIADYVK